jgi:dTDP-glucose pyrophosphorylase
MMDSELQIVIPMAGNGSRFSRAAYKNPKPLIPVLNHPMIEWVIKNLNTNLRHRFIFICQASHDKDFALGRTLREISPGSEVILLDQVTDGAAQTVLKAEGSLDPNLPLVIANCDQYISNANFDKFYNLTNQTDVDGVILTMAAKDPKWSFVRVDDLNRALEVREKQVISETATVGVYSFKRAGDFIRAAKAMISAQDTQNGEYYVAPAYNVLVSEKKNIQILDVRELGNESKMFGLGTPEDLEEFIVCETALEDEKRIF